MVSVELIHLLKFFFLGLISEAGVADALLGGRSLLKV
jgi:hypothetical protein